MTKPELLFELSKINAKRVNRLRVSNLILADKDSFKPLLEMVFDYNNKTSIKAAWILEFVCKEKLEWLLENIDYFTKNISKVHLESAVRPVAKVLEMLISACHKNIGLYQISTKNKERIIETTLDWMISKHKIAIKVYSMQTLYYLGLEHTWIHEELQEILSRNILTESAGYKARAKKIIALIDKASLKNKKK